MSHPDIFNISADSYLAAPEQTRDVDLAAGEEIYAKVLPLDSWVEGGGGERGRRLSPQYILCLAVPSRGRAARDRAKLVLRGRHAYSGIAAALIGGQNLIGRLCRSRLVSCRSTPS